MAMTMRTIPIEHTPKVRELFAEEPLSTDPLPPLTLLELVQAVDEVSDSEDEVIATVQYMIASGRLQMASPARVKASA